MDSRIVLLRSSATRVAEGVSSSRSDGGSGRVIRDGEDDREIRGRSQGERLTIPRVGTDHNGRGERERGEDEGGEEGV